jgi:CDP-paratose 2-epimerase
MPKTMLITGGAGFIGGHAALRFARQGWRVSILDDLSRRGTDVNLDEIREVTGCDFVLGDVRSPDEVEQWFRRAGRVDAVLHMAAQVAVTTSVTDPRSDFDVNALGTFNVLEATRRYAPEACVLFASTNKVYGGLEGRAVVLRDGRYDFAGRPNGVSESEPLDFHSPYGCSKGAADQYVRDYARIYGLRTVVVRQSCIYGTRQFGVEDQGWVAWFAIAAMSGRGITVYGDGRQVRDLLWIEDLLDLYERCLEAAPAGAIYNAGGGAANRASVLQALDALEVTLDRPIEREFSAWRPGDQKVFYSDNRRACQALGWMPETGVVDGLTMMVDWLRANETAVAGVRAASRAAPVGAGTR